MAPLGSPATVAGATSELIVDPEEIFTQPQPPAFAINDGWKDWETWTVSPDVAQSFPFCKMGYDLDGLAVFAIEFGKWDYQALAEQPEEKGEEYWKYFEQLVRHQQKDAGMKNGHRMVEILDWDGFTLRHHASAKAIKMAMKLFAGKLRVTEFLSYGYFVNVNYPAETFINFARPFVSSYLDKFEMYGGSVDKWKPRLLKKIGADQLAPKYGGTNADWKPITISV